MIRTKYFLVYKDGFYMASVEEYLVSDTLINEVPKLPNLPIITLTHRQYIIKNIYTDY